MFSTTTVITEKKNHILEALYEKYRYLMYYVALEILHDNALAEDAVHSAFLKLTKMKFKIDKIESHKTRAFMIIVTRNVAIDQYNKRKSQEVLLIDEEVADMPNQEPLPLDIVISKANIQNIQQALDVMDIKYADVMLLKYFYDYPDNEISMLLGITEQLVRVRLHRAKKLLVQILAEGVDDFEQA